jgi:hypothetical protein
MERGRRGEDQGRLMPLSVIGWFADGEYRDRDVWLVGCGFDDQMSFARGAGTAEFANQES